MVDLEPSQRRIPLSVQISDQLRAHIVNGDWAVGDRIPGEHELVEALGASRSTVREALRALAHSGLLEARPGDGTYVSASSELDLVLRRRARAESSIAVFEVREALELQAAKLACLRATPAQVASLSELLDRRDAAVSPVEHLAFDQAFHLELVAVAGNALLAEMYRNLDRAATYPIDDRHRVASNERWPAADPHRELVDALRERDAARASSAAESLITLAREVFVAAGEE
ncbi:GntR family transcriptional regulator [Frondihabitans sucicola]|uniref:GntR family transcriptional regulator n=1 Tax=Frondihabitans sucicola TaxID=1268041 RepID=A0ABN6Y2A7_9MICO|nr:FCD domain-containing protein [Frondihabitans sucicola]BDZ51343.1 GntR family transcriptional regulator [Frondihabitans sucicola]